MTRHCSSGAAWRNASSWTWKFGTLLLDQQWRSLLESVSGNHPFAVRDPRGSHGCSSRLKLSGCAVVRRRSDALRRMVMPVDPRAYFDEIFFRSEMAAGSRVYFNKRLVMTRASIGAENRERMSDAASAAGVDPRASTATFSPFNASSSAPRATVRVPSERISTMSRATTGGSPGCSASRSFALRTTLTGFGGSSLKRIPKDSRRRATRTRPGARSDDGDAAFSPRLGPGAD